MVYLILLIGLVIGLPVAFSILAALFYFMAVGEFPYTLRIVATQMYGGMKSFPLLAIPLFILAGELMNESGITTRIISFTTLLVGRFRAGLAVVNIWASVIFAGLSGSAVADTSAIGRIFIPEMEKRGYPRDFSAAVTAASSVIGPIIPPSIPVIIYALTVTGVSVPGLFLGGIGPGLLLATLLSIYVMIFAGHFEKPAEGTTRGSLFNTLIQGIIPLFMPVFVVGSILMGVVTPTEAACFAVAYALVVGLFIFRELKVKDLPGIFGRSMRDTSTILMVIGAVSAANWLMTYNRVPNIITDFALEFMTAKWMFLISSMILFLIVGLFLEGIAAMLVLVPIIHPIAVSMGIDPTHFGILVVFNLMIGLITPPMGLCLFVADSVAQVGLGRLIRQIFPLFLVEVLALIIIMFTPATVVWIPRYFGF
ncbi:MAG: TRAP transporter large permease [bacterium]|nr:MAG: TRAP transporter large permease [bacterium]